MDADDSKTVQWLKDSSPALMLLGFIVILALAILIIPHLPASGKKSQGMEFEDAPRGSTRGIPYND